MNGDHKAKEWDGEFHSKHKHTHTHTQIYKVGDTIVRMMTPKNTRLSLPLYPDRKSTLNLIGSSVILYDGLAFSPSLCQETWPLL